MNKINYYSHLLLNSRYSLLIKLVILFSIYTLFYIDNFLDVAYCTKVNKTQLREEIAKLQAENLALQTELARYRIDPDTLDSLKHKINEYRERNIEGFLTVEEQERPKHVTRTGVDRPDLTFFEVFFAPTKYNNVTFLDTTPHSGFSIDYAYIDETGKQLFDLSKRYRLQNYMTHERFSRFEEVDKWPFYDYKVHYKEVFYPANHPDNNFDPQFKRLRKIVGYEFYDTQIPDKISSKIVDNCNIS